CAGGMACELIPAELARACPNSKGALLHRLEPRVGAVRAPALAARASLHQHDVRREVVLAAHERGAHAVDVDRRGGMLERADLVGVEAARGDDLDPLVTGIVERSADPG